MSFGIPVLALLVLITTYMQSKLMTPVSQPGEQGAQMTQAMNLYMPLFMGYLALTFASGLALYFVASNLVTDRAVCLNGQAELEQPGAGGVPERRNEPTKRWYKPIKRWHEPIKRRKEPIEREGIMDNGASMGDNRTSLEIIAPSVEEAIAKGLADLGLTEDVVDVEVLDSGSKGLFGIGFRQARVRLTIKSSAQATAAELNLDSAPPVHGKLTSTGPTEEISDAFDPAPEATGLAEKRAMAEPSTMSKEDELTLHVARETVEELLERMNVRVRVSVRRGEPEDERDRVPILVDVRGDGRHRRERDHRVEE